MLLPFLLPLDVHLFGRQTKWPAISPSGQTDDQGSRGDERAEFVPQIRSVRVYSALSFEALGEEIGKEGFSGPGAEWRTREADKTTADRKERSHSV